MERVSRSLARCQEQPAFSGWCLSYAARVRTPEVFANGSVVYEKGAGQSARVRTIARVEPPWRHACRVSNDERWQDTKKTSSSEKPPVSAQPTVAERPRVQEQPLVHSSGGSRITGKSTFVDGQSADPPVEGKRTRSEDDSTESTLA